MSEADFTGRTFGGFKIQRKLGSGGMAVVYQAHEAALGRTVALKVIHENLSKEAEFVARFHREARAAAQLSHPNIVQVYTVGEEAGIPYFAMECVKGKSLQSVIQSEGFLTAPRVASILEEVCEALSAAHEAGIVHRDIKPSNIMLDGAGRVKVGDFGIAHMASESRLTQTGMMVGTPGYTSPEQCFGTQLDARSDIYALGVTAYEMLTGHMPFQADTLASLIRQIIEGNAPPLAVANPTVPPALRDIVERMMHKDPDKRFQTADDVIAALTRSDIDTRPVITQPSLRPTPPTAAHATAPTAGPAAPATEPTRINPTNLPAAVPVAAPMNVPAVARARSFALAIMLAAVGIGAAATAVYFGQRMFDADDATGSNGAQAGIEQPQPAASDAENTSAAATGLATAGAAGELEATDAADGVETTDAAAGLATTEAPAGNGGDAAVGGPDAPPIEATLAATPAITPAIVAVPTPDPPSTDSSASAPAATPPAANAEPRTEPERRAEALESSGSGSRTAPAPPPRTVLRSTTGDYENVDLVAAQVDAALVRGGFEILDLVPRARDVREVARFEVVSTVKLVGSRELSFANRQMTASTVALTVQATDLVTGTRAAGPFSTTVEFTSLNLQANLQTGVDKLAADLIKGLEARLAARP